MSEHGKIHLGDVGDEIATYASGLASELTKLVVETPIGAPERNEHEASRSEAWALECWSTIEDLLPIMERPVDAPTCTKLEDTLVALRTALPFNEAERAWLLGVLDSDGGQHPAHEMPQAIARHEGKIMVYGIRRAVNGSELMRRWGAWLRETGEFVGQGSRQQAQEALRSLQGLLTSESP